MLRATVLAVAALAAVPAHAALYQVEMVGNAEWNLANSGPFVDVQVGDEVRYSFQVDSDAYLDSTNYNVRGYEVISDSFTLTAGPVSYGLADPMPGGATPYFAIRDNDPAADGFFLTWGGVDWPSGLPTEAPGLQGDPFEAAFEVGYSGDTLDSLAISDAVGTYAYDGIQSFYFNIVDLGFEVIGVDYTEMTITAVPGPASLAMLAPFVAVGSRRRRR
jgi:hypothetical protein